MGEKNALLSWNEILPVFRENITDPFDNVTDPCDIQSSKRSKTMTSLNAADLQTYSAREVASLADLDFYAVRNEGERRQTAAEKKIAKLQKQLAKAQAEMKEAGMILEAAFAEQRRAA